LEKPRGQRNEIEADPAQENWSMHNRSSVSGSCALKGKCFLLETFKNKHFFNILTKEKSTFFQASFIGV